MDTQDVVDWKQQRTLSISCFQGVAPWLRLELEQMGYAVTGEFGTGVEVRGSLEDTVALNLRLRTALNVLYPLAAFACPDGDALYRMVKSIPWETMIPSQEYVCITSRVDNPTVNNSMFPNLKVKDAICDRMMDATGKRPDSGSERENLVLNLFWRKDKAFLYLNTSGVKISDRSYRRIPHSAPLRESLAAAILMGCGYDGSQTLVLPMCGSGTLAIEAALMGTNRAPGLLRDHFGFMHIKGFDAPQYQALRRALQRDTRKEALPRIIASDIDPDAVEASRRNARTAGVEHLIDFQECDFADTEVPDDAGIVLMNPPYGERLGDVAELEPLYRRIGDFFKQKCPGYTGYIFSGNRELAKKVGLRASRRIEFWNAKIDCRLFRYDMYTGSREKNPIIANDVE